MKFLPQFLKSGSAPGILLCIATLLALLIANSPLNAVYHEGLAYKFTFQLDKLIIDKPILLWINDALMAVFFLFIGLEIKKEVVQGHLSSLKNSILPLIAAAGGFCVPALIYYFMNAGDTSALNGWAVPTATDIAFALGVMMILGSRIPASLKVCLVTIAVIDDLFAVIVIALFYTSEISMMSLALAGLGLCVALALNVFKVTKTSLYILVGLFVWACVLKSGVHATLAGVAMGLIIPLKAQNKYGESPATSLEHSLHPWVNFLILPVFAFANAGISFSGITLHTLLQPITMGIMLGLFFGKQTGIMAITYITRSLKICSLPEGTTWLQYYGMALLTGIGFTMSLFIGNLAFTDADHMIAVKLGVLMGSLLSAICGIIVLLSSTQNEKSLT